MRNYFLCLLIMAILVLPGCEQKNNSSPQTLENASKQLGQDTPDDDVVKMSNARIGVYGRPTCSRCVSIMEELDRNSIDYTFYDTDANEDLNREMWRYVQKYNLDNNGTVGLPVVVIKNEQKEYAYTNPAFSEIKNVLSTK
ncbi:MAG: hypothetical protein HBSAPP04_00920 [Ignavibacteriaceae bacterium]|nr:MAG: hypothetical protein HBSAPP04_00920 [Ignavibacteriaceae bacterium]